MAMLAIIPKQYRREILTIREMPQYSPSFKEIEILERCFPNVAIGCSIQQKIAAVPESEKNGYYYFRVANECLYLPPPFLQHAANAASKLA